jgi:predicted dienelactone hydrolase
MKALFALFLAPLPTWPLHAAEPSYTPPTTSHPVEILRADWYDATRHRDIPVKIYLPKDATTPCPIVIFSHGLGGSRENYEYLGQHWAACGYVSVHLQHPGSDDHVWKDAEQGEKMNAMVRATMNPAAIADRPKDVSFALDRLTALNADAASPLKGRLDLKRIGVAGHSFGGFTSMAIAGQEFGLAQWTDPRVKAVIEMSAPVARPAMRDRAYAKITTPVFHMTGTLDDSPIGDTKAAERRIPFDKMASAETCLVIFKDGDHMIFSGRPGLDASRKKQDAVFQQLICASSTAYWDAWLKGDSAAHAWLMDGGFARQLGTQGTFETKKPERLRP